eukprot:TRINITY_DN1157_c1_g1_i2.p2 TRINITY_DN1157_c1_g1~~TRINITY_DN1157_c1_g1_i2.p2  ORF type:complete len:128 (+),score=1.82 TRINITY_DN1157_c1_g1_i2:262-645(+)
MKNSNLIQFNIEKNYLNISSSKTQTVVNTPQSQITKTEKHANMQNLMQDQHQLYIYPNHRKIQKILQQSQQQQYQQQSYLEKQVFLDQIFQFDNEKENHNLLYFLQQIMIHRTKIIHSQLPTENAVG